MKFFAVSLLGLFFSVAVCGQVQFGIFAGPLASSAKYTIGEEKQDTKYKYGFHTGGTMKALFEGRLYFAPAVFYSMKGYEVTFSSYAYPPDPNAQDNNTTIHTFEIAPMLQYDFGDGPGHFFIKAGPSVDFQISGKEKFNLRSGGSVDRSMKFSFGEYGRFGTSALAQLGYETGNGFIIFAQYTHGLGSINNFDEGPKIKHRVFGISIGKYFKNKKIVIDTRNRE